MGSWFAAIYDPTLWLAERTFLARWRRELLAGAAGDVLEIGAGTGLNLPHYGAEVRRLVVTEPDDGMRDRLARRLPPTAEVRPDPAERLTAPDASVDVVVGTLVLCTVPDPEAAISEIRRVLRPGGRYLFLEHVAGEGCRLALQRAVDPLWQRVAGGCHLARRTVDLVRGAGFAVEDLRERYPPAMPPFLVPMVRGVGVRA